jgi:hypothetical protein
MHGLGLSLWTGEDVPEMMATAPVEVERIPLKKDTDNWVKVSGYLTANKQQGVEKLIQQIAKKYIITPAIQKDLVNLITK